MSELKIEMPSAVRPSTPNPAGAANRREKLLADYAAATRLLADNASALSALQELVDVRCAQELTLSEDGRVGLAILLKMIRGEMWTALYDTMPSEEQLRQVMKGEVNE